MPEGTVVSNVEEKEGDRGTLARASGTYATIVGHSDDGSKTRIRLPSGARKTINGRARAMIGIVAGKHETLVTPTSALMYTFGEFGNVVNVTAHVGWQR